MHPVLFRLGGVDVYAYGTMLALASVLFFSLTLVAAQRSKLPVVPVLVAAAVGFIALIFATKLNLPLAVGLVLAAVALLPAPLLFK